MANKKKKVTAAIAVAAAAAMLMGGTFAWQSISQTALNEKEAVINPGGRLHDDFDGSNKDVYVENFAENDIFARVRLDEYFEIVMNKGTAAETTEQIVGTDKEDTATYATHLFDSTNATDAYWNWSTGGSTKYMPTFNKNKDSLQADINGTFENDYEDYVDYTDEANAEKTADAVYDADSNSIEDDGVETVEETHQAAATKTGTLISMEDWITLYYEEEEIGDYWVYDTDGWVYWSSPIEGNSATGLLLDGIELAQVMDDSYYYAINAVGQFITADDLGAKDGTGFYADPDQKPSDNALILLAAIGVDTEGTESGGGWEPSPLEVSVSGTPSWYLEGTAGTEIQLTASAMYNDVAVDDSALANVTWTLSENTSESTVLSATTGKTTTLTIQNQETGTLIVRATLTYEGET